MTIVLTFLGLLVGGIVNQLGSDLPAHRSLSRPHCPYCGRERPLWQWLALPAHLIGRAGCPSCGASIRLRKPLTEIGLAVAYGYLWIVLGPSVKLVFYLIYITIFAIILITDMERRLIPNAVTFPGIAVALIGSLVMPKITWWSALIGGAIGFLFFLVAYLVGTAIFGPMALGQGDITLALLVGLITGFPMVIEALVIAILVGAGISAILLITRVRGLRDPIPYGPFLVVGAVVTLMWGYPIAEWFLR
jgi:prepilin signal peptidase PulO-like enzyme (type II secretory pathway)